MTPTTRARKSARAPEPAPEPERADRLTLEQIVETALRLTREHGLASLTMRTLADELGVTPMATYYYVQNKEALIDLVVDAVTSRMPIPDPSSGTWSERLWQINRGSRKALAAHPGVAEALLSRPPTPSSLRNVEATIAVFEDAGFAPKEARLAYDMFEAAMFGRMVLDRAHHAPASDDKAYRWAFDTLIAGFEARIAGTI